MGLESETGSWQSPLLIAQDSRAELEQLGLGPGGPFFLWQFFHLGDEIGSEFRLIIGLLGDLGLQAPERPRDHGRRLAILIEGREKQTVRTEIWRVRLSGVLRGSSPSKRPAHLPRSTSSAHPWALSSRRPS